MSVFFSGLTVAPWKFDVIKTSIFALEASLLGQMFVIRTPNFRGATIIVRVFLSRNYRLIVAPRKFDVLKTNTVWTKQATCKDKLLSRS